MKLTLDDAFSIIARARELAARRGLTPLAYAVVDDGGHVIAQAREEGQAYGPGKIAVAKASGCVAMGMSGRKLMRSAQGYDSWFTAVNAVLDGQLVPTPGGVLIRDAGGAVIGALGVAGASSQDNEDIAVHGIEAAGFLPDRQEGRATTVET